MPIFAIGAGPLETIIKFAHPRPFPEHNIRHHFAGQDDDHGVYAKEYNIDAGMVLSSHVHAYDHLSVLAKGIASVRVGKGTRIVFGPEIIVVPKGEEHELRAVTPVTWYCIHPMSVADPDRAEQFILNKE